MSRVFVLILLLLFAWGVPGTAGAESRIPSSAIQQAFPALSPEEVAQLQKEGEITRYFFEPSPLQWLPPDGLARQIAAEASRIETVIGVESIHLLSFDDLRAQGVVLPETDDLKRRVYNVLRSVSTMKGVQYYSVTRGKIRTLFEESYAVVSIQQPERVPDPVVQEIPPSSSLVVFQEDTTFGQNYSRWLYRYAGNEFSIMITNLTPLKYSFFKLVDPEQMQIHLLVRPMEGGLSFYGCAVVKSARFLGLEKSSKDSFYNRIKAIYTWFKDQLTRELQRKGEGL
ncbi:MAG: hypothetical protein Kow009_09600 [Spirochaetales bacterium]